LLIKYDLLGARTHKKRKEKNAPARNAAQQTPDLGGKQYPIIQLQ